MKTETDNTPWGIDPLRYIMGVIRRTWKTQGGAAAKEGSVLSYWIKLSKEMMCPLRGAEKQLCAWAQGEGLRIFVGIFASESVDCPLIVAGKGIEDLDYRDSGARAALLDEMGWRLHLECALDSQDKPIRVAALRGLIGLTAGFCDAPGDGQEASDELR